MNDILFGNNNNTIIKKLAKTKYRTNLPRNIVTIIAIALATFLLYSVFCIGLSYGSNMEMQERRLLGTTADAMFINPDNEQIYSLSNFPGVENVGITRQIGILKENSIQGVNAGFLRYADENEWSSHLLPAMGNFQGTYPKEEFDIVLPTWVLEKLGLYNFQLGDKIQLEYYFGGSDNEYGRLSDNLVHTFTVVGVYEDLSNQILNNNAFMYVSESLGQTVGLNLSDYKTAASITLHSNAINETTIQHMKEQLVVGANQDITLLHTDVEFSLSFIVAILCIALLIVLCGGLLIYNILYITITQDIRFIGQLKTIGMSKRQIKKYWLYQLKTLCLWGIPIGAVCAAGLSWFIVPIGMKAAGSNITDSKASFSPLILVGAMIFSILMVYLGSAKPIKKAASISPVEALNFQPVYSKKSGKRLAGRKFGVLKMAHRNVFRNRKSAILVLSSLFLGTTLFLILNGLTSSMNANNLVGSYLHDDIIITSAKGNTLDIDLVERLSKLDGVENVSYISLDDTNNWIDNSAGVLDEYLDVLKENYPEMFSDKDQIKGNEYHTMLIGVGVDDFEKLNEELHNSINYMDFVDGKVAILGVNPSFEFTGSFKGPLTITHDGTTIVIDHLAEKGLRYNYWTNVSGTYVAPNLFISQELLNTISTTYTIKQIGITTDGGNDKELLTEIEHLGMGKIVIESKYEKAQSMSESFSMISFLGNMLSIILFIIGIMNFINTIVVSVITRRTEIAVLESVGMTKKQVKKMLVCEGIYYAIYVTGFILTVGTVFYLAAFTVFKNYVEYAVFTYPYLNLLLLELSIFTICVVVPLVCYHSFDENSIVERLRQN